METLNFKLLNTSHDDKRVKNALDSQTQTMLVFLEIKSRQNRQLYGHNTRPIQSKNNSITFIST